MPSTFFLTRIKHDDVLVHVYAGFPHSDVLDPTLVFLLSSLWNRTSDRWERFLYWRRLGRYPRHRVPTRLICLKTLHQRVREIGFPVDSLLDVFQHASQLEEFVFASPASLSHDCSMTCETVYLPRLKYIRLLSPNFQKILVHLLVLGVSSVGVSSVLASATFNLETAPAFQAPIRWLDSLQSRCWTNPLTSSISLSNTPQRGFATPCLRPPAVRVFAFAGDLRTLLRALTGCYGEDRTPVLPNLRFLFACEEILTEEVTPLIPSCLRSRKDLTIVLDAVNHSNLVEALGSGYIVRGKSTFPSLRTRLKPVHKL